MNTTGKVFTGAHQISVQSLYTSGNTTATASLKVDIELSDIPPTYPYHCDRDVAVVSCPRFKFQAKPCAGARGEQRGSSAYVADRVDYDGGS